MDRFIIELDEAMSKLFSANEIMSNQARDYGCGVKIFPSEIHMIEVIGNHQECNTTEITQIIGNTKGTVSKLTNKLEKKGFIRKYHYTDNKKEVYYKLTELGKKAFEGHYTFHCLKSAEIYKEFSEYDDEKKEFIFNFIRKYTELISQYI